MNQREQELDNLIIKIWELTGNLTNTSEGVSAFNFYGSSNKVRDAVEAYVSKTSKQDQLELLDKLVRSSIDGETLSLSVMKNQISKLKEELK